MSRFTGSRGLRHRRWQTILAVAAIGAAVALPVVLISVGGGVAHHELAALESTGYQIVLSGAGDHGISHAHEVVKTIDSTRGVSIAAPILSVAVDAYNRTGTVSGVLAEGVIPSTFGATLGPTESGLFPLPLPLGDPTDAVHYANGNYTGPASWTVLVSSTFASNYHVAVGDTLRIAPTVNLSQAIAFNVTGVFGVPRLFGAPSGAYAIVLPLSDLQVLAHLATGPGTEVPDAADTIEVVAQGSVAADAAALNDLANALQAEFPYYSVTTLSQQAHQLQEASALLTGFTLALSSVGLAVGVMFLSLVLLRRVEAERKEIGIRRAIGVPGGTIAAGLLLDGALLAGSGALVGVVAGWTVVTGLANYASSTVREAAQLAIFDPPTLAAIVLGVVGLSLVAGTVASRRALRTDVLEALR